MKWSEVKREGSLYYKIGGTEPIDLFKDGRILWDWCIGEIIAKAYRNRLQALDIPGPTMIDLAPHITKDLKEIKHYVEMLLAVVEEGTEHGQQTKTRKL